MSFWQKLGVTISDLECFKESCRQNGVEYKEEKEGSKQTSRGLPVHATLSVKGSGRNSAFLVREGGAFKVVMDNDTGYSAFSRHVGANGGKLTRDYAVGVVTKGAKRNGAFVSSTQEQPDGSVIIKMRKVA